jgi:hypothetical protein
MTDKADEPDSLRHFGPDDAATELKYIRRMADRRQNDQVHELVISVNNLKVEMAELKQIMQAHVSAGELVVVEQASRRAVELVFSSLGVDVKSPADLQRFRDDLRFGAMIRTAAQKGFFAALTAIITAVVGAIWYAVSHLGQK